MSDLPLAVAVGTTRPWEERSNGRTIRQLQMLAALGAVARVRFIELSPNALPTAGELPVAVGECREIRTHNVQVSRIGRLIRRVHTRISRRPLAPCRLQVDAEPVDIRRLRDLTDDADLLWFTSIDSATAAHCLLRNKIRCSTAMDLYDLESERYEQRLRSIVSTPRGLHRLRSRLFLRGEADAWDKWTNFLCGNLAEVFVTKAADARRLNRPSITVIPNGCVVPEVSLRPSRRAGIPRVLFLGTMRYGPNYEGARWLAGEVAPEIRRLLDSEIELRLVGDLSDDARSDAFAGAVATGYVDDVTREFELADLFVVPLKEGSGTRLKVLEAFSRGVPVVSTTIGCDGLDVRDGVHLLIRDDATGFAEACCAMLGDGPTGGRVPWSGVNPWVHQ